MKKTKIYIDLAVRFFSLENQDLKTIKPVVLFLHSICWFENFLNTKLVKKYSKNMRTLSFKTRTSNIITFILEYKMSSLPTDLSH